MNGRPSKTKEHARRKVVSFLNAKNAVASYSAPNAEALLRLGYLASLGGSFEQERASRK